MASSMSGCGRNSWKSILSLTCFLFMAFLLEKHRCWTNLALRPSTVVQTGTSFQSSPLIRFMSQEESVVVTMSDDDVEGANPPKLSRRKRIWNRVKRLVKRRPKEDVQEEASHEVVGADEVAVSDDANTTSSDPEPIITTIEEESSVEEEVAVVVESESSVAAASTSSATTKRSPTAASKVDLSGMWELVVSDDFKQQYDTYLKLLGQPLAVRTVALSIIGFTTEKYIQSDQGRKLFICGTNVRGRWERTLLSDNNEDNLITTADNEQVLAEAWWGNDGVAHVSWMRGVKKYGGGDFESVRYLEDNGNVLVCESTFHPNDPQREPFGLTWKFSRQQK